MRFVSLVSSAALAAAISACTTTDGGTPPPVVNATGPSGPVAAALNTTLGPMGDNHPNNTANGAGAGLSVDETFTPVTTSLRLNNNGTGFEFVEIIEADYASTDTFVYDATDNSFTINLNQGGVAIQGLVGSLRLADEGNESDFTTWDAGNGLTYSQLELIDVNSGVDTNYSALGYWSFNGATAAAGEEFFGTSVWGKVTPDGEVPDTGTGSYSTHILGWMLRQNAVEQLRGGIDFQVDFATGAMTALFDADIAVFDANGEVLFTDFATLSGDGALTGLNAFTGNLTGDADPSLTGRFDGQFYGPTANEIGGTFEFGNTDVAASGGFVGPGTVTAAGQ